MDGNRTSLLVVDDEEGIADVYAAMLADDYDTRTAYGGREALEKINEDIDIVLLDRRMPAPDGDEVLTEIRERGLDVRVGMITATEPDFDIVEMDFDDYLVKPLDSDDLHEAVHKLLTLSKHDEQTRELFSVAKKKAAIEGTVTESRLTEKQEYDDLLRRFSELDDNISERIKDQNEAFFRDISSSVKQRQR